jgi:hypothetical protein
MFINKKKVCWDTLLIGILIWVAETPFIPPIYEFVRSSSTATGTVVRLNAGGKHPQIEFTANNGQRVTFSGSSFLHFTEIGEQVDVRYNPARPGQAFIDGIWSIWGWSVIASAVGFILALAGLMGYKPFSKSNEPQENAAS